MTGNLSDLVGVFEGAGVPVAHVRHHDVPDPPYAETHLNDIVQFESNDRTDPFCCEYDVVLYAKDRDLELERSLEDGLRAHGIAPTHKSTGYHANVDLVTTTYQMNLYER